MSFLTFIAKAVVRKELGLFWQRDAARKTLCCLPSHWVRCVIESENRSINLP